MTDLVTILKKNCMNESHKKSLHFAQQRLIFCAGNQSVTKISGVTLAIDRLFSANCISASLFSTMHLLYPLDYYSISEHLAAYLYKRKKTILLVTFANTPHCLNLS